MTDGSPKVRLKPDSESASLAMRDAAHLWHPYTQMLTRPEPLPIVRGEGIYLFAEDGRRFLDGTSSWWVNIHGHSHPKLNAALAAQAREIEHVSYFKIETAGAAAKLRELIRLGGEAIEGPWDGEEGITLFADLDAGATGAMTGGGYPDGIREITDPYFAGRRDEAIAAYARWLPLINYENRQCGLIACKALMKEGGVIRYETVRLPLQPLQPAVRAGLIEIASRLGARVLRWGK